MKRPFELPQEELEQRIEEMVSATIADLSSEFLLMPTGNGFTRYNDFQAAYEVLKRKTAQPTERNLWRMRQRKTSRMRSCSMNDI